MSRFFSLYFICFHRALFGIEEKLKQLQKEGWGEEEKLGGVEEFKVDEKTATGKMEEEF